jgi:hypothetical protein
LGETAKDTSRDGGSGTSRGGGARLSVDAESGEGDEGDEACGEHGEYVVKGERGGLSGLVRVAGGWREAGRRVMQELYIGLGVEVENSEVRGTQPPKC